jgi:signal peptidase II
MKHFFATFRKYFFLLAIVSVGCNTDLTTKQWAETKLKDNISIEVMPDLFELTYVENPAVSFGLLSQIPRHFRLPLIFTLTISAVIFMTVLLWKWRKNTTVELIPLCLILSGAMGNILDRMNNGYVIDFIHFHYRYQYSFPVFNIADVLVFCGISLFIYQNWQKQKTLTE